MSALARSHGGGSCIVASLGDVASIGVAATTREKEKISKSDRTLDSRVVARIAVSCFVLSDIALGFSINRAAVARVIVS